MTSQLEFDSRAALCRQLAKREPVHQALWLAEAESWSRRSREKLRGDAGSPGAIEISAGPFQVRCAKFRSTVDLSVGTISGARLSSDGD
jgi:hypothetical protein